MKNNVLYYSVGPLLYCPANRISITDSLINERFGNRFSFIRESVMDILLLSVLKIP